jgi:hypothetical protein
MVAGMAIGSVAAEFGLIERDTLLLNSEEEMVILFDHLIYGRGGRTPVQKYLAKLPVTRDPDKLLVREAMSRPRYSMFEVEEAHRGTGVTMRDLVRDDSLLVVDEGLSRSMRRGRALAYRLLPSPEYWMTTGGGFPLSREAVAEIRDTFLQGLRATEGPDLSRLSAKVEVELERAIIRVGFQEGGTARVRYQ